MRYIQVREVSSIYSRFLNCNDTWLAHRICWSDGLQEIGINSDGIVAIYMQLCGQFLFLTRFIMQVQLENNQSSKGNQYYQWKFTGVPGAASETAGKSEEPHGVHGIPSTVAASEVHVVDPTSALLRTRWWTFGGWDWTVLAILQLLLRRPQ